MFSSLIATLHQYCREHYSFQKLADELHWSRAELAYFFENGNPSLDSVIKVSSAMGLRMEMKLRERKDSEAIPLIGA